MTCCPQARARLHPLAWWWDAPRDTFVQFGPCMDELGTRLGWFVQRPWDQVWLGNTEGEVLVNMEEAILFWDAHSQAQWVRKVRRPRSQS